MFRRTIVIALTALVAVMAQPEVKFNLITEPGKTGKSAINALVDSGNQAKHCAKANQFSLFTATDFVFGFATGGCGAAAGVPGFNNRASKVNTIKNAFKSGIPTATKRDLREDRQLASGSLSLDYLKANAQQVIAVDSVTTNVPAFFKKPITTAAGINSTGPITTAGINSTGPNTLGGATQIADLTTDGR